MKIKAFIICLLLFFLNFSFASEYKEGEVLVKLKKRYIQPSSFKTEAEKLINILSIGNIKVKSIFTQNGENIVLVKSPYLSTEELISRLKNNPNIEHVEPNYIIKPLIFPNDSEYSDNDYDKYWGLDKIQAFKAWDITTGSNDIVIAVLDTGIDYTHPDLKDNIWKNEAECKGADNEDDDGNGYIDDCMGYDMHDQDNDPLDYDGHGTHISGIIGAVGNNNLGIAGVNWHVKLLPCKIFDDEGGGYNVLSAAIECLNYIIDLKKRGVNIIASNNSWAASPGVYLGDILKEVIQESINAGILFVTAAGNEGSNNDEICRTDKYCQHVYPCDYQLDNDGIICVTATDKNDELPFYANYGKYSVDIAAPGDTIYSTATTVENLLTLSFGHYKYETGTSMAAPFVSGAVGLLKSKYSFLKWEDIKMSILMNVDFLPSLQGKILTEGRLNLFSTLSAPIKKLKEGLGIVIDDYKILKISFLNDAFYIDNDLYIFTEEPIFLNIELTDNDSIADLKFRLFLPDFPIEPAICNEQEKVCYLMDNSLYTVSTDNIGQYVNIYVKDNSIYDMDNETGKIQVAIAFVKPSYNKEESNNSGGCSLSKSNDYSFLISLLILLSVFLLRRKKLTIE